MLVTSTNIEIIQTLMFKNKWSRGVIYKNEAGPHSNILANISLGPGQYIVFRVRAYLSGFLLPFAIMGSVIFGMHLSERSRLKLQCDQMIRLYFQY